MTSANAGEALEAMEDGDSIDVEDRPLRSWEWAAVVCAFLIYLLAVIALGVGLVDL